MSVDGEETMVSAREYTRESLGDGEEEGGGKEGEKNEVQREKEPRINGRVGKRGTERPKRAGKASDMSKREQLLGSPRESERTRCRARGAGECPARKREGKREKKSYDPRGRGRTRSMCVAGCLFSPPKQRLASNLRACRAVAMASRCTL